MESGRFETPSAHVRNGFSGAAAPEFHDGLGRAHSGAGVFFVSGFAGQVSGDRATSQSSATLSCPSGKNATDASSRKNSKPNGKQLSQQAFTQKTAPSISGAEAKRREVAEETERAARERADAAAYELMLEEEAKHKDADKAKKKNKTKKKKERPRSADLESDAAAEAAVSDGTSRRDEEEDTAAQPSSAGVKVALQLSIEQEKGAGAARVGVSASATATSKGEGDGKGEAGSAAATPAAAADDVWITVTAKGKQRARQKVQQAEAEQPRKQTEKQATAQKSVSSNGGNGELSDSSTSSQRSVPSSNAAAAEHAAQARPGGVSSSGGWHAASRAPPATESVRERPRNAWGSGGTPSGAAAVGCSRSTSFSSDAPPQWSKGKEAPPTRDGTRSAPSAGGGAWQQRATSKQGVPERAAGAASSITAAGTAGSGEAPTGTHRAFGAWAADTKGGVTSTTTAPPPSPLSSPCLKPSQPSSSERQSGDVPAAAAVAATAGAGRDWPALDSGLKKESSSGSSVPSASPSRNTAAAVLTSTAHMPASLPSSAAAVMTAISEAAAAVSAVTAVADASRTAASAAPAVPAAPAPALPPVLSGAGVAPVAQKGPTNWAALVKNSIKSEKDSDGVAPTKPGFSVLSGHAPALAAPSSASATPTAAVGGSQPSMDGAASTSAAVGGECSCCNDERPTTAATQTSPPASPRVAVPKAASAVHDAETSGQLSAAPTAPGTAVAAATSGAANAAAVGGSARATTPSAEPASWATAASSQQGGGSAQGKSGPSGPAASKIGGPAVRSAGKAAEAASVPPPRPPTAWTANDARPKSLIVPSVERGAPAATQQGPVGGQTRGPHPPRPQSAPPPGARKVPIPPQRGPDRSVDSGAEQPAPPQRSTQQPPAAGHMQANPKMMPPPPPPSSQPQQQVQQHQHQQQQQHQHQQQQQYQHQQHQQLLQQQQQQVQQQQQQVQQQQVQQQQQQVHPSPGTAPYAYAVNPQQQHWKQAPPLPREQLSPPSRPELSSDDGEPHALQQPFHMWQEQTMPPGRRNAGRVRGTHGMQGRGSMPRSYFGMQGPNGLPRPMNQLGAYMLGQPQPTGMMHAASMASSDRGRVGPGNGGARVQHVSKRSDEQQQHGEGVQQDVSVPPAPGQSQQQQQRQKSSQQRQQHQQQPMPPPIAHTMLHHEIVHFMNTNLASCEASHIEVLSIMRCLEMVATKRWHAAKVELYGSRATGLYLASSDMDVTLLGVASQPKQVQEALRLIHDDLKDQKWVAHMKLITSARIPVLKIKSTSGVPVDITVSDSTYHTGLRARDLIVRYLEEAPQLAPMVVVLKSFLRELGLNDPFTGGMSSYSLVVLLWNYLCEASHNGYTTSDCGAIMVGFFSMFVNRFESTLTHVDDPLTPPPANGKALEPGQGDNILHSCYQIGRVCRSFRKALMVLNPTGGLTFDCNDAPLLPRLFTEVAGTRSTHEVNSGTDPTGSSTQTDARESPAAAAAAAAVAAVAAGRYKLGGGESNCRPNAAPQQQSTQQQSTQQQSPQDGACGLDSVAGAGEVSQPPVNAAGAACSAEASLCDKRSPAPARGGVNVRLGPSTPAWPTRNLLETSAANVLPPLPDSEDDAADAAAAAAVAVGMAVAAVAGGIIAAGLAAANESSSTKDASEAAAPAAAAAATVGMVQPASSVETASTTPDGPAATSTATSAASQLPNGKPPDAIGVAPPPGDDNLREEAATDAKAAGT